MHSGRGLGPLHYFRNIGSFHNSELPHFHGQPYLFYFPDFWECPEVPWEQARLQIRQNSQSIIAMLSTTCGEKKKNDPHSLLRCRKLESWSKLFLLQVRTLFAQFFFSLFQVQSLTHYLQQAAGQSLRSRLSYSEHVPTRQCSEFSQFRAHFWYFWLQNLWHHFLNGGVGRNLDLDYCQCGSGTGHISSHRDQETHEIGTSKGYKNEFEF